MAVIVQIAGGLGNQLFQYATARRLAQKNQVSLKLDAVSGFKHDVTYQRRYLLEQFNIQATQASPLESFDFPGARTTRNILRFISRMPPFIDTFYVREKEANGIYRAFEPRLLNLKVRKRVFLEGYWQSEKYFKDIEDLLVRDLEIRVPHMPDTLREAAMIKNSNAVCVGIRSFAEVPARVAHYHPTLCVHYYHQAMDLICSRVRDPSFFIFTENPDWVRKNMAFMYPTNFLTPRSDAGLAREDLWLMTLCKHFIVSNSSFHWWGAWLSRNINKLVIAPATDTNNIDMIPDSWLKLKL